MDLEGPHWRFATELYGNSGVADACLELQDLVGLDVVLMMFVLYAVQERGLYLDERDIRNAAEHVSAWRTTSVLPLRHIRRRLKTSPAVTPIAETESVRSLVKAAELRSEQIALAMLVDWAASLHRKPNAPAVDSKEMIRLTITATTGDPHRMRFEPLPLVAEQAIGTIHAALGH